MEAASHPDREVQTGDPRLRKQVLGLLTAAVVLSAFGVRLLDGRLRDLQDLAKSSPHEAAEKALVSGRVFLAVFVLGVTVLAVHLGRLSWRTLRTGRYPPPGARVIHDIRVLRGAEARRRGRAGLSLAVLVLAAGLMVAYSVDRKLSALLDTTLRPTTVRPADLGVE